MWASCPDEKKVTEGGDTFFLMLSFGWKGGQCLMIAGLLRKGDCFARGADKARKAEMTVLSSEELPKAAHRRTEIRRREGRFSISRKIGGIIYFTGEKREYLSCL